MQTAHFATAAPGCTLIIGGQKSGKSKTAEMLAQQWLAQDTRHRATLIACGVAAPSDPEMLARIARHQDERRTRIPKLQTLEEPLALPQVLAQQAQAQHLMVVDCLSTWLGNQLFPLQAEQTLAPDQVQHALNALLQSLVLARQCDARVVLISHEIGLGVIPLGREVRQFVDTLGSLNQTVAAFADAVIWMVAGIPLSIKNVSPHQEAARQA